MQGRKNMYHITSNIIFQMIFKKSYNSVIFITALFCSQVLYAQTNIPIGAWRSHFAVNNTTTIDWDGENTVYAGAAQGLVRFDIATSSFQQLSKQDGFSESEVAKIKYHDNLKIWLITYKNGNIDILDDNKIYNLDAIARNTNITSSKQITHINFNENNAYLSAEFGVVVVNLAKKEIKESYLSIGDNGSSIKAYSTACLKDSIFIASSKGIIGAAIDPKINKLDYRNWRKVKANVSTDNPSIVFSYKLIAAANNKLYAVADGYGVDVLDNNQWTRAYARSNNFYTLSSVQNQIFTTTGNSIIGIANDNSTTIYDGCLSSYELASKDGKHFWSASHTVGLCYHDGIRATSYSTKTVYASASFRMFGQANTMTCTSGGYSDNGLFTEDNKGFYQFNEDGWSNYSWHLGTGPYILSASQISFNRFNGYYYISSLNGLLKWKSQSDYVYYNDTNSPLTNLVPGHPSGVPYIFNIGVNCDSKGTVWSTYTERNPQTTPILYSLDLSNNWKTYTVPYSGLFESGDLFIDSYDNKWLIPLQNKSGVIVFNENSKTTTHKRLIESVDAGSLPGATVNCLANARNGEVWVGTTNGVCVFNDPGNILQSNKVNASIPVYDSRALLRNKIVTCIKADAADRKWIATNDGLWFFNQDGSELLAFFNTENSPLPSNNILSMDIIETTGELFIATSQGIVSYRSDASVASDTENSHVLVFPNPVKPEFNGPVAITGLINEAVVKITDITGALVFQTVAKGGTATWNQLDVRGKKVQSGIYLIFSSDSQGGNSLISKLAIIE